MQIWTCLSFILIISNVGLAQIPGSKPSLKHILQSAMKNGDSALVWKTTNLLKIEAGTSLGTASQEPIYRPPDSSEISTEILEKIWNGTVDQVMVWELGCPELSTGAPAAMLGLYIASTVGKTSVPIEKLISIGKMLEAQQYNSSNCLIKNELRKGAFGLVQVPNNETCAHSGNIQRSTLTMCKEMPENCPTYSDGLFAGKSFTVADQIPELDIWDGSIAYHQGWAVEEMIQAYLYTGDSIFLNAATLGGEWCLNEVPVTNYHYSAKVIWALAALYDLTGELKWKAQLLELLKVNLLPGILMDQNADGIVDGTSNIAFDSLVSYSRIPGRMWNESNASSWNTAICAMALAESYASLRNRGDLLNASFLKPYVIAMMNNICHEINQNGTPPSGPGFRDLTFSAMNILWSVERAENASYPQWKKAAKVLWNSKVMNKGSEFSVNIGQFVRHSDEARKYESRFDLAQKKRK